MQTVRLSLEDFEVRHRFDAFRTQWTEDCTVWWTQHNQENYHMLVEMAPIDDFVLMDAVYDPFIGIRTGDEDDPMLPGFCISVVVDGVGQIAVEDSSVRFGKGDIFFYDRVGAFHFNAETRHKQLLAAVPYWRVGLEPGKWDFLWRLPAGDPRARLLRYHLETIQQSAPSQPKAVVSAMAVGFMEMVRVFLHPDQPAEQSAAREFIKKQSILRFIDENLHRPDLGPDFLAKTFAVSRAVLYRMFNDLDGIANHIRNRRLDAAYARLANSGSPAGIVGDVADQFNFYDHAHFNHRFRERFGFRPKELADLGRPILQNSNSTSKTIIKDKSVVGVLYKTGGLQA